MSYSLGRRGFLGLAGLAVGASALTACGDKSTTTPAASNSASGGSSAPAAGAGTITVWTDSNREPVLKPVAAKFKADTGVTVKFVVKDFAKLADDFVTQVPTGKGPDASIMPHDATGRLVQNGVVAPVELGDASAFEDVAVQAFTYDGQVYGVPYSTESVAILRNTELAPEKTPDTFDAMIEAGKKVVASGKAKYPFLVGLDPKTADAFHLYPFQTSFGAPVFELGDKGFDASKLAMGGEKGAKFAAWLAAQGKAGILNLNVTQDISKAQFFAGKTPYLLTGPWNLADAKKAGIKYAIDPIPKAGDQDAQAFVTVQGFVMSAKTQNSVAVNKFLVEYVGSEEVQTELYKAGLRAPANKAAYEAAKADKDVADFGAVSAKGVPMPNIPAMSGVWTDWGTAQAQIVGQKAADPAKTWETMVTTLNGKIKK
ncbi:maltose ABC transporter substrate-binding protein [Luteococcus sp. H138]|uniref:sugar ABC transporter substrate-binding protein n=1 Tax=unclassified Luteococcus TaxID=2639923 RepID=UPI00313BDE60